MAKKLTSIAPVKNQPSPEVVKLMRHLLEKAESGEINGIAMVASYAGSAEDPRGTFSNAYVGDPNRDMLGFLGSLAILEERILRGVYVPERDG